MLSLEWYRCTITSASANRDVWDVVYDDGDEGFELCRTCVRPFTPYAVNESLDIRISDDEYVPCHILAVHQFGKQYLYDVQLDNDSWQFLSNIETKDLRRMNKNYDETPLAVNTRVTALYRDESGVGTDYYPGTIEQMNADQKTYVIRFDDGDYSYNVHRRDIELL